MANDEALGTLGFRFHVEPTGPVPLEERRPRCGSDLHRVSDVPAVVWWWERTQHGLRVYAWCANCNPFKVAVP